VGGGEGKENDSQQYRNTSVQVEGITYELKAVKNGGGREGVRESRGLN
jgi:hypothetical protein